MPTYPDTDDLLMTCTQLAGPHSGWTVPATDEPVMRFFGSAWSWPRSAKRPPFVRKGGPEPSSKTTLLSQPLVSPRPLAQTDLHDSSRTPCGPVATRPFPAARP